MPEVVSRRRQVKSGSVPQSSTLEYGETDTPPPKRATSTTKDVPVGKILSTTMQKRIAGSLARSTSMTMLNSVGPNYAISATEAFNVYHPTARIVARHMPDLGIKINLPKADADDVELIVVTALEYVMRIIDGFFLRAYNKRVASLPQNQGQNTMPQPTQRETPQRGMLIQQQIPVVDDELEDFVEVTGEDVGIAPMKNGNGSISDLISAGLIPGDMGDNIG